MTQKHAQNLQTVIAVFLSLATLTTYSQLAEARDTALLNQAVTSSNSERVSVEREYKTNDVKTRTQVPGSATNKSIALEIGDGLGGTKASSDQLKLKKKDQIYREKAVAAKLDREWKALKESLNQASHEENLPQARKAKSVKQ